MNKTNLTSKSKYLSLLLRHKPEQAHLTMDKQGWVLIDELVDNAGFSPAELAEIIRTDEKGRYAYNKTLDKVRATQGHNKSLKIDIIFEATNPPHKLYHGTKLNAFETIEVEGLKPMNRQFVHLSEAIHIAKVVASRRPGISVVLEIDAKLMDFDKAGKFYKAENGVWLADFIPAKYIKALF